MIRANGIIKKFKTGDSELVVLKGLDLHVKKGEFLAITGRSGSGKSTLMYQLSLLDEPNAGEIFVDDVNILKLKNEDKTNFRLRELGFVFQDYALIPELNSIENVMLPLLMQGVDKKEAEKRAVVALEKVGLGDKLINLPSQLSGGQQQRVSIARAIGHNPKIIFADEPTANLDTETAKTVLEVFQELSKEGQTIVMVTHEKEYALVAHRVITLADGVITESIIGNNKYLG
ncbi:MAG: ABC transporter ATP-binding protein [Candidatus Taylorbacteria bacterium]|nr:ABC transporter ATP-binding protein [Candidatus Taylorbacteria bacterium]